ncbi:HotDog domain-containing protein [Mycotypha africana]|uniref:HotDog domain-containing protein n=1 Tax=Mycotypha africana TaxID=64632 RepID=UPI0023011359|nr:HotDog domain-containing protein [Mycotypha africana]KAI8975273.1 HotDog domain-containing protein [Mycotypha africana]
MPESTASQQQPGTIAVTPSMNHHLALSKMTRADKTMNEGSGIIEEHDILSPEEAELKHQEENDILLVQTLRNASNDVWIEVDAYWHLTDSTKAFSLTANTLRGQHKILRRPLKFYNKDKTECILIIHVGDKLCSSRSPYIHNGLLATLLDEHLAFVSLPSLPNYTGFTANLNIDYREPVEPNQWLILRGKLNKIEGRKAFAEASIENIYGDRLAEATSLYISPRPQT